MTTEPTAAISVKPHVLNRILPRFVRDLLRAFALRTIPSMRHLDMRMRLAHLARTGFAPSMIIDVGAAQGEWVTMASRIWPRARIFGIEPNARNMPLLEKLKHKSRQFDYWKGCLGPQARAISYHENGNQTSLLDPRNGNASTSMMRLDDLIAQHGLPAPDFIKLDVQGYELEVLKGGATALRSVEAILMEVNFLKIFPAAPTVEEVIAFMSNHGLAVFDVMGIYRMPSDDALAQMDFLFLRVNHPLRRMNAIQSISPASAGVR
jgi:FkbM family methyltransferase